MPRWPGPLLVVFGAILAFGALGAGTLAMAGGVPIGDPRVLAWIALAGALLFAGGLVYVAVRQLRIRRFLPPDRYRGPGVLVLLFLVLVVASVLTAPFGSDAAALLLGEGEMTLLGSVVILVATQLALLLVSWLFVFRARALEALPSLRGPEPMRAVAVGLGWGVLAWLGATLVSAAVTVALDAIGFDVQPDAAVQAIGLVEPWLVIGAFVILAPIAEEVFFRGVVFNALRREGGRRWAFLGSSALFAVIHVSVVTLVPIFLLGLALAWVYERTNNLLAPIAMHAIFNGIALALALLVRYDVIRVPV